MKSIKTGSARLRSAVTLTALLTAVQAVTAQGPATLLVDANQTPTLRGSMDRLNTEASTGVMLPNGAVLFTALRDDHGYELYTSLGLPGTSFIVRDISPGPSNSFPGGYFLFGGEAYFFATTPGEGRELWKSDGSFGGTVLVRDLTPGPQSSAIVYGAGDTNVSFDQGMMAELGGKLYVLMPGAGGLYETDGTAANTVLVKSLAPYTERASTAGAVEERRVQITVAHNKLFFAADGGTGSGVELWVSDGTPGGTSMLRDIRPGLEGSFPAGFEIHQGDVYFRADDGANGFELWRTDGTLGGTVLVADIRAGVNGSAPKELVSIGSTLVFAANATGTGFALHRTDGTMGGTVIVSPTTPTPVRSFRRVGSGDCVFVAGSFTTSAVYATDGTVVAQLSGSVRPSNLSDDIGGRIYFQGNVNGSNNDYEVYATDVGLTTASLVAEVVPGVNGWFWGPMLFRDTLFGTMFFADDGVHGIEPWITDGTQPGTVLLDDINPTNSLFNTSSGPGAMVTSGGLWFGRLEDGVRGPELWVSDGTPAGTSLLMDIQPGSVGSNPYNFQTVNGRVFFSANDGVTGQELWITDGTPAGTNLVADIRPGTGNGFGGLVATAGLNGLLLFAGDDGVNGFELWRSDGTSAGTFLLKDINPGSASFAASGQVTMATVGNHVYFHADDGSGIGRELWKTDGTLAGTVLVADLNPSGSSVGTSSFTQAKAAAGGKLFFAATDGVSGTEPWVSDGTPAGTFLLADVNPGPAGSGSSDALRFYPVGDRVFFYANDGTHGFELWVSDGTIGGTHLVVDLNPGSASALAGIDSASAQQAPDSFNTQMAELGGQVIFAGSNGQNGVELWKSDGTAGGTVQVADIEPGVFSSEPNTLLRVGSRYVYFAARTTQFGTELWRTDGTTAGTVIISDIAPGDISGYRATGRLQNAIVPLRGKLIVSAYHPVYDEELFAVPLRGSAIDVGYDMRIGINVGRSGEPSAGTGAGCAAFGALPPRLSGTDPVVGGAYSLSVTNADPNAVGALWIGSHAAGAPLRVPFLLGDCPFYLNFAVLIPVPFSTDASGNFALSNISVAASPGTIGLTLAAHALVLGPSGAAPLGIAGSNGVFLTGGL